MMPLVSVVIPTYNRAALLVRAVESARAQTYRPLEIVIVDDGSTDGTSEAVKAHFGSDPIVRYQRQDNRGVAAARNHAISIASGKYVAFLDSDDQWDPWKLELQVHCLERYPDLALVWTDMAAVDDRGTVVKPRYLTTMYEAYGNRTFDSLFEHKEPLAALFPGRADFLPAGACFYRGDLFAAMIRGNHVHTSTVVARREIVTALNGFREDFRVGEDYDLYLRITRDHPVGFLAASSIRYRVDAEDMLTAQRHHLAIALNYLASVEQALKTDKAARVVTEGDARSTLAYANEWVGYRHLDLGDLRRARPYFVRSLRYRPMQPMVWGYLAAGLFPNGVSRRIRNVYQLRKRLYRSA